MSVDRYLDRQQLPGYDCLAFARDVWRDLTGIDLAERVAGLLQAHSVGKLTRQTVAAFRELPAPVSPCLVLMRRPRGPLHIGVYIRGNVLHLKASGVEYQPVSVVSRLYKTVQFIAC